MANDSSASIRLNNVRLSFPQLFAPYAPPPKPGEKPSKPAYSAHFLLSPDNNDLGGLRRVISQVAEHEWGENGQTVLKGLIEQNRVCLRSGDGKTMADGTPLDGYAGNWFLSSRSYTRPTVIDGQRQPLTEADGKPYSGCYVNAVVRIWAQKGQYGKRINCQLMGVQFARDGEAFGGGRPADPEEFDTLGDFAVGAEASTTSDAWGGSADSLV
jgi:hypothetical protein